MKNKKLIHELLHYLYSEREKIESTGYRIDQDLRKSYRFINEEIQNLQMMLFEQEYNQFSERLEELFQGSPGFTKKENGDAV
jgi:aminoglycoside phosphotransferase family enzyme